MLIIIKTNRMLNLKWITYKINCLKNHLNLYIIIKKKFQKEYKNNVKYLTLLRL